MSEELTAPLPQSREEPMENEPTVEPMTTTTVNGDAKQEDAAMPTEETGGSSSAVRPIFFGNLSHGCVASDVEGIFERPVIDCAGGEGEIIYCSGCAAVLSVFACWF